MSPDQERSGRSSVPPRWVFLGTPRPRAIGRSSGVERAVMPGYLPVGNGFSVVASNAGGAERAEPWGRIVERLAEYERYAERAEREIPVVILEPNDEEADA